MAVETGKPAYIFNQIDNQWYKGEGKELVRVDVSSIPRYTTIAGVGTRDLNDVGRQALNDYVNNTIAKPTTASKFLAKPTTASKFPIITPKGMLGLGVLGFAIDVYSLWKQYEEMIIQDKKRLQEERTF